MAALLCGKPGGGAGSCLEMALPLLHLNDTVVEFVFGFCAPPPDALIGGRSRIPLRQPLIYCLALALWGATVGAAPEGLAVHAGLEVVRVE